MFDGARDDEFFWLWFALFCEEWIDDELCEELSEDYDDEDGEETSDELFCI